MRTEDFVMRWAERHGGGLKISLGGVTGNDLAGSFAALSANNPTFQLDASPGVDGWESRSVCGECLKPQRFGNPGLVAVQGDEGEIPGVFCHVEGTGEVPEVCPPQDAETQGALKFS